MNNKDLDYERIIDAFVLEGEYIGHDLCENGHINRTYSVKMKDKYGKITEYLIQQINTVVFKNPDELMENIVGVTSYIRDYVIKNGGDPERETLSVFSTAEGKPYYLDDNKKYWRCYNYIANSYTCQTIDDPEVFYNAAKAFGHFQRILADYPIETLHETIPNFHNTVSRFNDFEQAVKDDKKGRAGGVKAEIEFAYERKKDADKLLNLLKKGRLPIRVTHNDTKLNNVLFDNDTHQGICVVDLDTVMPGLSLYDFGDSIRFGANTALEDERDVSLVSLDLELYEQYARGYLHEAGSSLNDCEIENLSFSSKLMTLECGIRFLTDYLNGDEYFNINYPEHNLVRTRTQLALVADIERKLDKMEEIVQKINRRL
ncbi:MAG: aminoglycoside phosphotransferase family protein [Clostridiales bacterium]|nr:aminoglycoside phosphotransferase family protein [Clostridiales bacterium]